jgi:hypothetical protein
MRRNNKVHINEPDGCLALLFRDLDWFIIEYLLQPVSIALDRSEVQHVAKLAFHGYSFSSSSFNFQSLANSYSSLNLFILATVSCTERIHAVVINTEFQKFLHGKIH